MRKGFTKLGLIAVVVGIMATAIISAVLVATGISKMILG